MLCKEKAYKFALLFLVSKDRDIRPMKENNRLNFVSAKFEFCTKKNLVKLGF
jgi:hypothetical protein